ncbi:MAG: HEAT repeat domain-containing protein [Methylocystis sp.]|uniref:HEAT repeat domain-containing protein n=1 Tax=Methylocystis sp. TaxID=1911079 RepID=UPI003DA4838F
MRSDDKISSLFQRTLACDYDDDDAWEAVNDLRSTGSREVFEWAARWLQSDNALERARAADILGQIGVGAGRPHAFPAESCNLLIELLHKETHSRAAASAIVALGHIEDPRALPVIYKFVTHEDAVLRHAVAFALGCFVSDPVSHPGLMVLMGDDDEDVRDWATFSLGVWGDLDSARVRDALARRLGDSFENVRLEAIAGLAKRGDRRVLPVLIESLDDPDDPDSKLIEAACALLAFVREPGGWTGQDYANALRQRFRDQVAPIWQ